MKKSLPPVAIVALTWNRRDSMLECLASIDALDYPDKRIILVDNASTDGTAAAARERFPGVELIVNERNLGAIGGKNVGLRRALDLPVPYVFMVDDDVVLERETLRELVLAAEEDPRIGLVGPKMFDLDRPEILLAAGGRIDYTENIGRHIGEGERDDGRYDDGFEPDYLCGAVLLARSDALREAGLFDSDFVGYWYEDTDLSVRVRASGLRVVLAPRARVRLRAAPAAEQLSYRKKYLASRNAIRFLRKHAGRRQWARFLLFTAAGVPYALARDLLHGRGPGAAAGKALGILDGLLGREKRARRLMGGPPPGA
ncbi:MAG: glycosyltransferase family 2 protein [Candidatus Eisenbacteria bacterium]|nr:glycosyltransferase family 2 protein [Candidatus Eisenbacteria bacterium]